MQGAIPDHAARPGGLPGPASLLGRVGTLETRLAASHAEVNAAQALRFSVFSALTGERGTASDEAGMLDADRFDDVCDHLLVIDRALPGPDHARIVGTYRLLRQEPARLAGGFYSSAEFDLDGLVARHPDRVFLELGRSCVLEPYRSKRTIELLWQGIWAYVRAHGIDVMAGCASFAGTVPALHAQALSFLARNCGAQEPWNVRALASRHHTMDLMPEEAIDARAAFAAMPPLVKGYLRLGARIGDGCVVDHDFGTTDVFIVLPVEAISPRYINYYGAEAERFAA